MAIPPLPSDALLEKYNTTGPRYTSYPTAPMWQESFDASAFEAALVETFAPEAPVRPLSLYVHLPFCEHRCLFCSCNVVITQQREQAEKYLGYLFREIERQAATLPSAPPPALQYHWGGGTPTYLSPEQIARLFRHHTALFPLHPEAEIAIEVDPRVTTWDHLQTLRELGFNRVSMGLQDLDPQVQAAVRREQSQALTQQLMEQCRTLGFGGLNIDLIYGLPYQTAETFGETLAGVLALDPDRLALYNYAHVPWMSPHQRLIPEAALPAGTEKFKIFRLALQTFAEAGYCYIGMDHFAKPNDALCQAQEAGQLSRNFMGYTIYGGGALGMNLLGCGVSAISGLANHFAQNQRKLISYYRELDADTLPIHRGLALTEDDRRRRAVIQQLLCHGSLDPAVWQAWFGLDFDTYFHDALAHMADLEDDGLLVREAAGGGRRRLRLTPLGRIFCRNVAMRFDAYLQGAASHTAGSVPMFSKTL
jgi:oxygen-independent coproporphyrinogen-3 oxidase